MWRASSVAALCCGLALLWGCGGTKPPEEPRPAPEEIPVGYGTLPREDVTGAVESVPAAEVDGQHVESVEEWLRGRVAGLQVIHQPNGELSLRIRGNESLTQQGDPLVVIDGMAVSPGNLTRALRSLNPREIDNIQVLKDVSSTSVYGTQGAHGVILITTKHD